MEGLSKLIKRKEEEKGGNPITTDARGLADAGTGTVAHRAVIVELPDARAGAVAYGAVTVNLPAARTTAVVNGLG